MPQAQDEDSAGLSIDIRQPKHIYRPGDSIEGRVVLNTASERAIGRVSISFYGRAKVKIRQNTGQSEMTYRSRANLFSVHQELYSSPYTFKPGSFEWPFSLRVPYAADENVRENRHSHRAPFRSTEDHELRHPLPPPVGYYHGMFGRATYAFVEYVLAATLKEPPGQHVIRSPKTKTSTRVIHFQPFHNPEPIEDHNFISTSQTISIRSPMLLPEHAQEPGSASLLKRSRSIFQRSSLPNFAFAVNIRFPSTLQVRHPSHIPFYISVTQEGNSDDRFSSYLGPTSASKFEYPQLTSTTSTNELLAPSHVILKSFALILHATTTVRARTFLSELVDSKTSPIKISDPSHVLNHHIPISPNPDFNHASLSSSELNLGHLLGLRLTGARLSSHMSEWPLVGSFSTYNIAREFRLSWVLELACLGKTVKVSSADVKYQTMDGHARAVTVDADRSGKVKVVVVPGPEVPAGWEELGSGGEEGCGKGRVGSTSVTNGTSNKREKSKAEEAAADRDGLGEGSQSCFRNSDVEGDWYQEQGGALPRYEA